jgi:hypothetical protein
MRADWFESRDYLLNIENLEWCRIPKKYQGYFARTIGDLKGLSKAWVIKSWPTLPGVGESPKSPPQVIQRSQNGLPERNLQ